MKRLPQDGQMVIFDHTDGAPSEQATHFALLNLGGEILALAGFKREADMGPQITLQVVCPSYLTANHKWFHLTAKQAQAIDDGGF